MIITNSAAEKVAALKKEENTPNQKLRVYVQGGGCSGFQYAFTWDSEVATDDLTFRNEEHDVTVVIDCISEQYLLEATLDYRDDKLNGSAFIIRNPAAKTTCGCGSSFSG